MATIAYNLEGTNRERDIESSSETFTNLLDRSGVQKPAVSLAGLDCRVVSAGKVVWTSDEHILLQTLYGKML
jgi:hypothetical protein